MKILYTLLSVALGIYIFILIFVGIQIYNYVNPSITDPPNCPKGIYYEDPSIKFT